MAPKSRAILDVALELPDSDRAGISQILWEMSFAPPDEIIDDEESLAELDRLPRRHGPVITHTAGLSWLDG